MKTVEGEPNAPLVLLSGLAADARIFAPQKISFPQLNCPRWLVPNRSESMDEYAKRLAASLDGEPCIIGGASFGGIIALHLAEYVDAKAVILIGSIKSPSQLPLYARFARKFRFLIPFIPIRFFQFLTRPLTFRVVRRYVPFAYGLACQFRDSDPTVFKWSLSRILDWKSTPTVRCPILCLGALMTQCCVKSRRRITGKTLTSILSNFMRSRVVRFWHRCVGSRKKFLN